MSTQEPPSNSSIPELLQFSVGHLLTLLSHFDAILDLIFATHLLRRDSNPSRTGTGFGVALIFGTLAALLIDWLAKREMMQISDPDQWYRVALIAAGSMFALEDCTMIMAIAHVDGSYDDTDPLDVATVTVSLLSGFVSIVGGMIRLVRLIGQFHPEQEQFHPEQEQFDWYRVILICMWIGATSFYSVLLLLILVDDHDDDSLVQSGSTLIGAMWVVYVLQLFAVSIFTVRFLLRVFCGKVDAT